eukprot:3647563-Pyramimonas_sp.AAC.1
MRFKTIALLRALSFRWEWGLVEAWLPACTLSTEGKDVYPIALRCCEFVLGGIIRVAPSFRNHWRAGA